MASSEKKLTILVEENARHPGEHVVATLKGDIVTDWTKSRLVVAGAMALCVALAFLVSPLFWAGWLAAFIFVGAKMGYGVLVVTDRSLYVVRDGFLRPEIVSSDRLEAEHFTDEKLKTLDVGGTTFKFKMGYEKRFHEALEAVAEPSPIS